MDRSRAKRLCFNSERRGDHREALGRLFYKGTCFVPADGGEMWFKKVFVWDHFDTAEDKCSKILIPVFVPSDEPEEGGTLFMPTKGGYYVNHRVSMIPNQSEPWSEDRGIRRVTLLQEYLTIEIHGQRKYTHRFQAENPGVVSEETPLVTVPQFHAILTSPHMVRVLFTLKNEISSVRGAIVVNLLTREASTDDESLLPLLQDRIETVASEAREKYFVPFTDKIRRMVGEATKAVIGPIESLSISAIKETAVTGIIEKHRFNVASLIVDALQTGSTASLEGYLQKNFRPLTEADFHNNETNTVSSQ